jgi:hypothetical protein
MEISGRWTDRQMGILMRSDKEKIDDRYRDSWQVDGYRFATGKFAHTPSEGWLCFSILMAAASSPHSDNQGRPGSKLEPQRMH